MAAVDPSTYTAAGADSGVIATDATTVTVTAINANDEAYLSFDYGVDHIEDFVILATLEITATVSTGQAYLISVSNAVGDYADMDTANNGIAVQAIASFGSFAIQLRDTDGDVTSGNSDLLTIGTEYFLTLERSGTTGTLTIRTGSHGGTVVDTLSITVSTDPFRYHYISQSVGSGSGSVSLSYTLADIDADFVSPPSSEYTHLEFHRRIGVIES